MYERRGVLDTLFSVPERLLQVGAEREDVVKVRELGVALDGLFGKGDRIGGACAHDEELEVEQVCEVFFAGYAPLPDLFGTDGKRIAPHGEREEARR